MDSNELLMVILAFFLGFMSSDMMKNICDNQLVEGFDDDEKCDISKGGCTKCYERSGQLYCKCVYDYSCVENENAFHPPSILASVIGILVFIVVIYFIMNRIFTRPATKVTDTATPGAEPVPVAAPETGTEQPSVTGSE
jgi:hypothetical protein